MTEPILTIHRSSEEIGGNCIEITSSRNRIILDIGRPLDADQRSLSDSELVPSSLDLSSPVDGIIISHPHQDHYGLLSSLPQDWPVWSGEPTEQLILLGSQFFGKGFKHSFSHYKSGQPFNVGPFKITPFLTDHSAFDAHMLLIEVDGKRIFYTGDFRFNGRKNLLPKNLMENPPENIDVLLMEGTNLGKDKIYPTEATLENNFADLFKSTKGRVFVSWSAQNIDRTVTLFRACKKSGRTLVIDLYTAEVLEMLKLFGTIPQPDWDGIKVVVTSRMMGHYQRKGKTAFVEKCVPNGMSASKLEFNQSKWVIMTRNSLMDDYIKKGVKITPEDAWSFSLWRGYLEKSDTQVMENWFKDGGAKIEHIHTSGHAAPSELKNFANAIDPRFLVPIHSFVWDDHMNYFKNVARIQDGEQWAIS
jgi:ribonuclease J